MHAALKRDREVAYLMVVSSSKQVVTDVWVKASWEEFVAITSDPKYAEARTYFDDGEMRIEMAALGVGHGRQNSVVCSVITLFIAARDIAIISYINTTFEKVGEKEFQPDVAFYVGEGVKYLPPQSNSSMSVDLFGPPSLIIEVGASSVEDDLGRKRLLYERVGAKEYWVVDVEACEVIAFSIEDGRSGRVQMSEVLPGLDIGIVEEALRRSQSENDGAIAQWLMKTFAQQN